ncbi:MAG: hypothetical protein JO297_09460 [Nitrososphaeraceae archaeon]|nr:hypothetical protein [Nitrososphaeraceae archaeon]
MTVRLLVGVSLCGLNSCNTFSKVPFQILWHNHYNPSYINSTRSVKIGNGNRGNQGKYKGIRITIMMPGGIREKI